MDEHIKGYLFKEKNVEENYAIYVKKTNYLKCLRCWQFSEEVKENERLCIRCKKTLETNV